MHEPKNVALWCWNHGNALMATWLNVVLCQPLLFMLHSPLLGGSVSGVTHLPEQCCGVAAAEQRSEDAGVLATRPMFIKTGNIVGEAAEQCGRTRRAEAAGIGPPSQEGAMP